MMMNDVRQKKLAEICAAADQLASTKSNPSQVTAYSVSMALYGKKPGGDFYALFEQWLSRHQAPSDLPRGDMPAEAEAQLESLSEHIKAQIMQQVTIIVRDIAVSFERMGLLRGAGLERLLADQTKEKQAIIETLVEREAELAAVTEQNAVLNAQLAELRDYTQQLHGQVQLLSGRPTVPPVAAQISLGDDGADSRKVGATVVEKSVVSPGDSGDVADEQQLDFADVRTASDERAD